MMGEMTDLIGATVTRVVCDPDRITFDLADGRTATFYHSQDCCESVEVEDVNGDWSDIIGAPLLVADERVSTNEPDLPPGDESNTWTFYTFRTIKGSVDVRWHGSSNGYYSENVELMITPTRAEAGAGEKEEG